MVRHFPLILRILIRQIGPVLLLFSFHFHDANANTVVFSENKKKAEKAIIFLHGFFGDAESTWTNKETHSYFPRLIAEDQRFKNSAIIAFEYPSDCHGTSAAEAANKLFSYLNDNFKNLKSISFVNHSFGGIVGREFILNSSKKYKIDVVVNLATPNLGSMLSSYTKVLGKHCILRTSNDLNTDRGGNIDRLNDSWIKSMEQTGPIKRSFEICSAYENLPIGDTIFNPLPLVVQKDSAILFSQDSVFFNTDHLGISKPTAQEDQIFIWVSSRLESLRCFDKEKSHLNAFSEKIFSELSLIASYEKENSKDFFANFSSRNFKTAAKAVSTFNSPTSTQLGLATTSLMENDFKAAAIYYKQIPISDTKYFKIINEWKKANPDAASELQKSLLEMKQKSNRNL